MKIALIGTRGVPAQYGGFETCAEELGKRLVEKGHEIWVYGRSGYYDSKIKESAGMRLVFLPELKIKFFETLSHTFFSLLHASVKKFDVLLVFNNANSPLLILPKILRKKVLFHMDGLEWKRGKWSRVGQKYYKFAEWLATKLSFELVSDSNELKKYFKKKYGKDSHYIAYGAPLQQSIEPSILVQFDLEPNEYFLMITRFEPENNPLLAVKAFETLNTGKKLVLVGGTKYKSKYSEKIFSTKDKRVKFLGFQYDKKITRELLCNCCAYIHGNEVGGTNPALLEAMASGCFVICRDVVFNQEVLRDAGIYFKKNISDLSKKISWVIQNQNDLADKKNKAKAIIQEKYDWDIIVAAYEKLFSRVLKGK